MPEEKTYTSMYSRNAELYHHGIQGQKWGVTNGPPYPLDSAISTGKRLKKAAKKEAKLGSKEYRIAKQNVKDLKYQYNLNKTLYKNRSDLDRKDRKRVKDEFKNSKMKYEAAKKALDKNKANTKAAKDFLKKIEDKRPSELAEYLKEMGWTENAIMKLAMKDYKSEQRMLQEE